MRKMFTCIDIGTDKIKAITVEEYNDKFNVLATASCEAKGIKKGLIVDAALATNSVKRTVKELESKLGTKITQVLAVVPSNNRSINIGSAEIKINNDDHIITGENIFACMNKSLKGNVNPDEEVVSVLPIEYQIDNGKKVQNPLGLEGTKLAIKSVIVSVPKKNVYSVVGIIENIGIEVVDITISSLADYYSIADNELNSKVVAIVDIGKEKEVISVFNKGVLIKEKIVAEGAKLIDSTIALEYKTDENTAKMIKEEYGVANRKYADSDENYKATNRLDQEIKINQYQLSEIIEQKLTGMLKNIKNDLNDLTNREISYIIVTGAVTSMLGFDALVGDVYGNKGQVLNLNVIGLRDGNYSACYGSIKYFVSKLNLREKEYTMFADEKVDEMLKARRKLGKGSVLGKIFGKIFE